ncbi:MAG TPA: hypothetical protein VF486_12545 [Actinomycetes bacterium]
MRTSPRQHPGAGFPPGASMPDVPDYEGQRPYAEPVPNGTPLDQQYAGYGMPEVDDSAYARALYGDGGVHAGPGTGLGYTDASWASAPYAEPYYGDPDATDPDLASSAYGRAMYGDPGQAAPPLEDPGLGHAGTGYGHATDGYGYGYDPATMPAPGYGNPDATGPMAGERDQVDLAYYGPGGEPAYGYAQPQAAPAYGAPAYDQAEAYAPAGYGQPAYDPGEPGRYDPYEEDAEPDGYTLPVHQLRRRSLGRAATRRAAELVNGASMTLIGGVVAVVIGLGLAIVAGRMMTTRQLFFSTHATAGIVLVHAFGGGLSTLVTRKETRTKELVRKWSTVAMAGAAWVTMIVGTFFGYAGYRAVPRPGVVNLNAYPQKFLWADKSLAFWDTFGMEWKVNSGWLIPFLTTAVAFVALKYNRQLVTDLRLRKMLTNLFVMAFAIAIVGSMLGFILNTVAPNDFMHRPWHI